MFQSKEQDNNYPPNLNETDINTLPDKELKRMIIKVLTDLRRMNEHRENFNNNNKYKKKSQSWRIQ